MTKKNKIKQNKTIEKAIEETVEKKNEKNC